MAKNKGILDAEAADVKEEADSFLKAKKGQQRELLFNMAAAAFGSKAQGLDLGGIMTAGLKTDAEQRKLNTESEKALRESKKQMRRYEQALRAGEDDKAAKLYGLAQTEAGKAYEATKDRADLALKKAGLETQRESVRLQAAQGNRNPTLETIQYLSKHPEELATYQKMHPSPDSTSSMALQVQKMVMSELESSKEWLAAKTPAEKDALVKSAMARAYQYVPSLRGMDAGLFSGGAGTGSRGQMPVSGGGQ
jgi:hypothetical protein